jgi:NAD(P)-dependent dehydrogenase (short-subunit alcohol dehydrogenase family)
MPGRTTRKEALMRPLDAQAYRQSKLAQIMFTFDLADELDPRSATANCLHPATYMPTKIVRGDGTEPVSSLDEGVHATLRLG